MALFVDIEKRLGSFRLQVQFETKQETLALLGASGSGKSMTLKCIAGLERPERGRIILDGRTLFDSSRGIDLKPQQRHVGYLFQSYALFPNMTVRENIACGAKARQLGRSAVDAVLQDMELQGLEDRRPAALSGGQQQRVALARLLLSGPEALLLDEPFSALDSHLRFRQEQYLQQVLQQHFQGRTVILVSHDRDEAFRLADSIAVMEQGRITAAGEKHEIFLAPGTRGAAALTGCKNISRVSRLETGKLCALDWAMELTAPGFPENAKWVGIRMHDVQPGPGENQVECLVDACVENPFSYVVALRPVGQDKSPEPLRMELSKEVWRRIARKRLTVSLPAKALLPLQDG